MLPCLSTSFPVLNSLVQPSEQPRRIVTFLSGLAHITLPVAVHGNSSLDEAWVTGGADGLIIAVDTVGTGHITTYPTDEPTVALQTHFGSMEDVPAYSVVNEGPCHSATWSAQLV